MATIMRPSPPSNGPAPVITAGRSGRSPLTRKDRADQGCSVALPGLARVPDHGLTLPVRRHIRLCGAVSSAFAGCHVETHGVHMNSLMSRMDAWPTWFVISRLRTRSLVLVPGY